VDTPDLPLLRPGTPVRGFAALRTLSALAPILARYLDVCGPRQVLMAAPRSFCAGVERAISTVERLLDATDGPVYVRRQIVHNAHVVADLEQRGAIFVEEIDEVPSGATAIFSAHGVSPAVRAAAAKRNLDVIDATCPLVSKVHAEARRFAQSGFDIVLVGHEGHEEVEGTFGEAPASTQVIASVDEVERVRVQDPDRVAYLTQTTLAIDETAGIVDALRERFPALVGPASSDICYATQNRQDAVRAVAADCDVVLVVGSRNSSNSCRVVEVAERAGRRAALVEDGSEIPPGLLIGCKRVGLTAGASAPETLVEGVVRALDGLGGVTVGERTAAREDVYFKLPPRSDPQR
jgi:4-hydroxy-3-methylbut-2-enyl diphosphate reductase